MASKTNEGTSMQSTREEEITLSGRSRICAVIKLGRKIKAREARQFLK